MNRHATDKHRYWLIAAVLALTATTAHAANICNVAPSGGDITGAALSQALAKGSQTLTCGTNITINDTVTWSKNKLTFNAQYNININASLNGSGRASLMLKYGQGAITVNNTGNYYINAAINLPAGSNFSTQLGSNGVVTNFTVITALGAAGSVTATDLQGMNGNLAGNYALGGNIDATATSAWNVGAGFTPIGSNNQFAGTFDGLGHVISNLTVNISGSPTLSGAGSYAGLFGQTGAGSVIQNVGLIGGNVSGVNNVGELVAVNSGTIINSYATGNVSGAASNTGGLVGCNCSGSVSNSYATGNVNGNSAAAGGLVGYNGGSISNSYATGSVHGNSVVGGLAGGDIESDQNGSKISNSYATGSVSGNSSVGGLVGATWGAVSNSYWNTQTSGQATSAGGTGLTTAQMQTASSFAGFKFTATPGAPGNNWVIVDADSTLNNAVLTNSSMQQVSSPGATFPMLASEYSTTINNAHQLQLVAMNLGANYTLGTDVDATATVGTGDIWGSAGFVPVGNATTTFTGQWTSTYTSIFTGIFDGLGHTINNLTINTRAASFVGMFGYTSGSTIQNVAVTGGNISGDNYVGTLVGQNGGAISNCSVTGSVTGATDVGGMVGINFGNITSSHSASFVTGTVASYDTSGSYDIGGLVGGNNNGGIYNSYATGSVSGPGRVGGLVGNSLSNITASYATGNVSGGGTIGGLLGRNHNGTVNTSYATGNVSGNGGIGGLVGHNFTDSTLYGGGTATISSSYATGSVTGNGGNPGQLGGLVGINDGTINTSYATGSMMGTNWLTGGLVGNNNDTITSSFWNKDIYATGIGGGNTFAGTGLTIEQMHTASSFAGFNFTPASSATWVIVDVDGTLNNAGGAAGATYPMLASEYSTAISNAHQLQLMSMNLAASYTLGSDVDASATTGSGDVWGSTGFVPVSTFTGVLDGLGHTIKNLTINLPPISAVGLFGMTGKGSVIRNVGLSGSSVSGNGGYVGTLVGGNNGTVSNSYAAGNVNGNGGYVGGLVGGNNGTVSGSYAIGGMNGGGGYVGGLVGFNIGGTISNSYAMASLNQNGGYVGGLVGLNSGAVSNSYAAGGLGTSVGFVGGLVGVSDKGTASNNFWDTAASGQSISAGGIGMVTADMQMQANFTSATTANGNVNPGWDFTNVWQMNSGTYPLLRNVSAPR